MKKDLIHLFKLLSKYALFGIMVQCMVLSTSLANESYVEENIQARSVSGKVISSEDNQGIPGVNVILKGTTTGTVTDINGSYSIEVNSDNDILVFSSVGYTTQEIVVGSRSVIDVTMGVDVKSLQEIVVIGYTQQSRMLTTSSISSVNDQEMKNIPSASPVQALQGKMAGVSIPVLTGQPGAAANIVIRGGTTLDPFGSRAGGTDVNRREPSDPLVIVDGVFRSMDDLNPDDIESIQVMKDAASTAIYGARGANGVIVVTTKTGKGVGKSTVNFRYQHGFETQARNYDYLNAREFLSLARPVMARGIDYYDVDRFLYQTGNSATTTVFTEPGQYGKFKFTTTYLDNLVAVEGQAYVDNLLAQGWETMDDPVNPGHTIIFKDSHYQDVVWQPASSDNYNVAVSGSSDAANYNVSLGYVEQGGVYLGTGFKRFSGLTNAGYKVNDKLKIDLNLSYLWTDDQRSDNIQRDLTRGVRVPPLNRLYNDDGTPNINEGNNPRNRLHQLYYQDNNENTAQYILRLAAEYEILPNFYYRPSASFNSNNYTRLYFEKFYPEQPRPRDKYQRKDEEDQVMTDHILQYTKTFGENHNVMLLGGFNYTRVTFFNVIATSQRSATDYISTITGDPASTIINGVVSPNFGASSSYSETKSSSLFAQASYDYAQKYLFGAAIRRDGFSNFAPENRYAIFPSVSAGWNISQESFWNIKPINNFKLRVSWGEAGNSNLSINDTYGVYGSSAYATNSGLTRSNIPNGNLLWESTETFDVGTEMSLLDSRFYIAFDYYNKLTKNRLADLPLAAETGYSSIAYNVGSLRNRGIELTLNGRIIQNHDFTWDANFTFAFNRTMVVELPENGRDKNRINGGLVYDPVLGKDIEVGGYAEGERPLGLWAWKSNGIFATDAEAAASEIVDKMVPGANLGKVKHGGDVDWADINGDKVIDGKDLVFMGYRVPDKMGGMQNTLKYKGFELRFTFDYAMGNVISDGALGRAMGSGRSYNEGAPREALSSDTWQEQGDTGKKYPRYSFGDYDVGFRNHLRFVSNLTGMTGLGVDDSYGVDNSIYYSKGDWLAFRELSIAYSIPKKICNKLSLEGITLNGGVYNIGYISAYKGLNPEQYKGYDEGGYPRPREFLLGASLSF